jgi:hypothetical protein
MKTSELTGAALDWAVAKADQPVYSDKALIRALTAGTDGIGNEWEAFNPSTNWSQGGPIIERESISVSAPKLNLTANWHAGNYEGPTPLIAACRFYVASKLGDEIEIPEELL